MSLFLAPIHHNMYNKIKNQNEINVDLLEHFGDDELSKSVITTVGEFKDGILADVIDHNNIHGWLQGQIDIVEKSFSFIVENLLAKGKTKEDLVTWFENRGKNVAVAGSGEELYRIFSGSFLDGMPCDRAIQPMILDETEARWVQKVDVHEKYWNDGGVMYNELRCAWIKGLAENSGFNFGYNEGNYEVNK